MASITLQQAKDWLRIDFDEDDDLIESLIESAEQWVETYTCHVLSPRDIVLHGTGCAQSVYEYPINSVSDGVVGKSYSLFTDFTIPSGQTATINVGYANTALIPKPLITAVKKLVNYMYENRDTYTAELPTDVQVLINQYRRSVAWS